MLRHPADLLRAADLRGSMSPAIRRVTSRQNPLAARFREAARGRGAEDVVLIEGATLVREAVGAGWTVVAVAAAEDAVGGRARDWLADVPGEDVDRILVPRNVLAALSPAPAPSGVVALARLPARSADPFGAGTPLVAIASDVQDPGNVGALARAAEAAGASGLFVCGGTADPFGWKALRGSMGSAFRLPVATCAAASDAIGAVRSRGVRVLALTARDGTPLYDVDLRGPIALLAGGEGAGLSSEIVALADVPMTIPMQPPVESLNVAVAAAVALYEARRQRTR